LILTEILYTHFQPIGFFGGEDMEDTSSPLRKSRSNSVSAEGSCTKLKLRKRGSYSTEDGEIEFQGVLADWVQNGKRRLKLSKTGKAELRQSRMIETAVALS
jgi:hypothetical protein